MNKLFRLIILIISLATLSFYLFLPIIKIPMIGTFAPRGFVESLIESISKSQSDNIGIYSFFVVLFIVPAISLFIIGLSNLFRIFGKASKIKGLTLVILGLIFLIFAHFLPTVVLKLAETKPSWLPDKLKTYIMYFSIVAGDIEYFSILYLAMGSLIVIFALVLFANLTRKKRIN